MPFSVICHGCAQTLEVPDDYPRRKMRCPACGVMCEIPVERPQRAPARTASTETDTSITREPARTPPPESEAAITRKPARRARTPAPEILPIPIPGALPPEMLATPNLEFSEEDDGKPYGVAGGLPTPCPNCNKPMEPRAKICEACEYDPDIRATPEKVYEPVDRAWEAGAPFGRRLRYWVISVFIFFLLGLAGTISSGEWLSFVLSWLTFTGMLVFLFGTFDRVNLTRNARGQVRLFHSWRFCFVRWTSARVPLKDYDGVVSGRLSEASTANWLVFGFLVLSGLLSLLNLVLGALSRDQIHLLEWIGMLLLMPLSFVPAGIAYYIFFHKISFFVAMSLGHGYPSKYLYKGWSEEHMRDLAETVSEVTTVPYHRG
jgi:hypothetical protein